MIYEKYTEIGDPPYKRAAYSDRTAWLMAEMSYLAYIKFEKPDGKKSLEDELAKIDYRVVDLFYSDAHNTQAYLAQHQKTGIAVLVFRGTETALFSFETLCDVVTDLNFICFKDKDGSKIHQGFFQAYQNVKTEIVSALSRLGDAPVYLTGHSLGGALAIAAAKDLADDDIAACYTYGSPMVGNEEHADRIKPPIYRLVHGYDLVPFLPHIGFLKHVLSLLSYKFKVLKKFLSVYVESKEFVHPGTVQYIAAEGAMRAGSIIMRNYNDGMRGRDLIAATFKNFNVGADHHDIKRYCKRLGEYAQYRQNLK